ncbi:MAG: MBL fold metallo-hydrolase [Thermodesulfobacteria bacterium]|nr:MBL fold metallo-hydrolase [Thermodesulfobacteriota bacterium]
MGASVGFFGGAQTVTGSCFLLDIRGTKILIDCGMFQGLDHDKNYQKFPFNPEEVSYLLLTHAHIDHCGRIPLLVKEGFKGDIICTKPTAQIAKIMLLDAAKVMKEHYKTLYRKAIRKGKELPPPPLYDTYDVIKSFCHFRMLVYYDTPVLLKEDIKITFRNAGHILGSAFIEIEDLKENKKLVFSGDLGNKDKPIIKQPELPKDADFVFMETTYGDRNHKSFEESKKELLEAIVETFDRGGNVLIPSFALERAQEILFILREFYEEGKLPKCHVFLDSPLAIKATQIFKDNPEFYDEETFEIFVHEDPFDFPYLEFTEDVEESKTINNFKSNAIIIAGNGTVSGGRILHHLKNNLWRPECSLVFVGFQPKGTLGRNIVNGAKKVHLFGEEIPVKAKVYTINGFSSHADQSELLHWLSSFPKVKTLHLIHGEPEKMEVFEKVVREKLGNKIEKILMPSYGEVLELY